MDAYLAVASKRDQREYAERPVPKDAVRRILDAGRTAGSAKNRQPWRFLVLGDRGLVDQVAQTVYAPSNLLGAPLVIAIVVSGDAIRSLAISQNLLGTEEIILIHHTDCGMMTFTDEELAQKLDEETGERPEWRAHAFADLEEDVREGIAGIKASPFIPRKESVRGFVYDVKTGELREVS